MRLLQPLFLLVALYWSCPLNVLKYQEGYETTGVERGCDFREDYRCVCILMMLYGDIR